MPVIVILRRMRQEDGKTENNLGYKVGAREAWNIESNSTPKEKKFQVTH